MAGTKPSPAPSTSTTSAQRVALGSRNGTRLRGSSPCACAAASVTTKSRHVPASGVLRDLQRRAQPFLQMLPPIHPAGGLGQRRLAPTANDQPHQRADNRHERRQHQRPERQRQQMPHADQQQGNHRPHQQPVPQAAQRPRPASSPRRLPQRRLDDLQFAHGLGQACRTRAPLASSKTLDRAAAK